MNPEHAILEATIRELGALANQLLLALSTRGVSEAEATRIQNHIDKLMEVVDPPVPLPDNIIPFPAPAGNGLPKTNSPSR